MKPSSFLDFSTKEAKVGRNHLCPVFKVLRDIIRCGSVSLKVAALVADLAETIYLGVTWQQASWSHGSSIKYNVKIYYL